MKCLENDRFKVYYTDRMYLSDGYEVQLVEATNTEPKAEINLNNTNFKVKNIGKVPSKTTTIFLIHDKEYVGHVSANVYEDNTASISASNIEYIPLPIDLEYIIRQISIKNVALNVSEKYRNMGKGKELIWLMLNYLAKEGVKDVSVIGISNEIAMKTYLSTGATRIDDNTAIYKNIAQPIINGVDLKTKNNI